MHANVWGLTAELQCEGLIPEKQRRELPLLKAISQMETAPTHEM